MSAIKGNINSVHNRLYKTPLNVMTKKTVSTISRKSSIEGLFLPKIYAGHESDNKALGLGGKNKRALYNSIDYTNP